MNFSEYQDRSKKVRLSNIQNIPRLPDKLLYFSIGLFGESGEFAEKIKKIMRDHDAILTSENKKELAKELGDILWYLTQIGIELDYSLEKIVELNLEKIESRQARGVQKGNGDNR